MCVYRKVEDKLPVMPQNQNFQLYSKKEVETLHLRLNIYDLTSSSWIYSSLQNCIPQLLRDSSVI